jgi:amino acid adenylation domain-containing protein
MTGVPARASIHEAFSEHAEASPSAVAIIDGDRQMSYGMLHQQSGRLAAKLRGEGSCTNIPIALLCERSIEAVIGILGILKAGSAYLPIDIRYPAARIKEMALEAGVALAVVDRRGAAVVGETGAESIDVYATASEVGVSQSTPSKLSDIALVIFTSGTTAKPKGVEIPHSAIMARSVFGYPPQPADLQRSSLSVIAHVSDLLLPLITGGTVIIAPGEAEVSGRSVAELVRRHGTKRMVFVPSQLSAMIENAQLSDDPLQYIDTVILSGEPLTPALARALKEHAPHLRLINGYGATELTGLTCLGDVSDPDDITVGDCVRGCEVLIINDDASVLPPGEIGEVCLAGLQLARGYTNESSLSLTRFIPHPAKPGRRMYRTGDRGILLHDGRLRILGRIDNVVKVRGYRVNIEEVEAVITDHPGVAAVACSVVDTNDGQILIALVQWRGPEPFGPAQLRSELAGRLPAFMVPGSILRVATLPLQNGKINRLALPSAAVAILKARCEECVLPAFETPAAQIIAEIWRDILKTDHLDSDSDFFRLGGDSLRAMRFIARARARGLQIQLKQLARAPRLGELAALTSTAIPS